MAATGSLRPLDRTAEALATGSGIREAFLTLVERFRPHRADGLDARWVIELTDEDDYTFHVRDGGCMVSLGRHEDPHTTIRTDAETWRGLVSGREDSIAAFTRGTLQVEGDLNLAIHLESLFRPGPEATRFIRVAQTDARGVEIESIVAGRGTPVLLLHGLCASKVSFLPTLDGLSARYEVHALDLPGFGRSDKPLPRGDRYSPAWMAGVVRDYMRTQGLRSAYVVGNSMGGRIGTELAMRSPRRVPGVIGLGSAVAFDEWQWAVPILRLTRAQWLGVAPFPLNMERVVAAIEDMFHDPGCIPAANIRAAAQEFLRGASDARNRMAILACARHLASEPASGRRSFWRRLEELRVPTYWIWGEGDRLSSCRYADKVRQHLPGARVEVWPEVGHVPQFEVPERTNASILGFLDRLEERSSGPFSG